MLPIRRLPASPETASAPVSAAISSTVRPRVCRRKIGSVISPAPYAHARAGSELGASAEAEPLRPVVALLGDRHREVEAQRAQGRIPDQADADRRADRGGIVESQVFAR